ncbi:MAG: ROK family protein [Ktedonobacteraceae bacterium]
MKGKLTVARASSSTALCTIINSIVEYLAVAIINLVAVIDPGIVVFGGDLSELPHAEELFIQPIAQLMKQHAGDNPQLRLSQLKGDASLYGAVQAAISEVLNTTHIPVAESNERVEM